MENYFNLVKQIDHGFSTKSEIGFWQHVIVHL